MLVAHSIHLVPYADGNDLQETLLGFFFLQILQDIKLHHTAYGSVMW